MGWPNNDPEGYDEVCQLGILAKVRQTTHSLDVRAVRDILGTLWDNHDAGPLKSALIEWAGPEIDRATADYLELEPDFDAVGLDEQCDAAWAKKRG